MHGEQKWADKRRKTRQKARGCLKKVAYPLFSQASAAAGVLRRKGESVDVYLCEFCHYWHVGH